MTSLTSVRDGSASCWRTFPARGIAAALLMANLQANLTQPVYGCSRRILTSCCSQ